MRRGSTRLGAAPGNTANCIPITSIGYATVSRVSRLNAPIGLIAMARRWRERRGRRISTSTTNDLEITTLRAALREERDSTPALEFPSAVVTLGFSVPITSVFPGRDSLARTLAGTSCSPCYITTGDESKMNRRRKSRRPRAISTENFAGEFTLAYLMAPLHHQRVAARARPLGDKVATGFNVNDA